MWKRLARARSTFAAMHVRDQYLIYFQKNSSIWPIESIPTELCNIYVSSFMNTLNWNAHMGIWRRQNMTEH